MKICQYKWLDKVTQMQTEMLLVLWLLDSTFIIGIRCTSDSFLVLSQHHITFDVHHRSCYVFQLIFAKITGDQVN